MTDILNQIDATLEAVMEANTRRFDLSAGGEVAAGSTSACAMRWAPRGQDSIEEESAAVEPSPASFSAFVAGRPITLADMEEASAAVQARRTPWICSRCRTEFSWDLPGLRRLHEVNGCAPPVDAALEPDPDVRLVEMVEAPEDGDEHSWGSDSAGHAGAKPRGSALPPVPWWRRMLGGGTR